GHPFVELTSTSVFGVRDLHPIVHVHAGRTSKNKITVNGNFVLRPFYLEIFIFLEKVKE
ncbi:hypothetical protein HNR36_002817, partial [Ureibacillus thermosphaericus]|nr:hypothetical protein [Ureibacillus thermosphaericus]